MRHIVLSLLILFVVCIISLFNIKETFTSPGTLVQLATSHVPDENDIYALRQYRRQVRHDLIDMTGSP